MMRNQELSLQLGSGLNMKTSILFVLILMSAAASAAWNGPGAGGGTNVYPGKGPDSSRDVLVDFAPTNDEIPINPRTYQGILGRLQPKIERLNYFFPGIKEELEVVFRKQWKLTTQKFLPDEPGQRKPIKQDDDFVKITYDWIKTATDLQKEQAWLHEMVRGYVQDKTERAILLRSYLRNDPAFLKAINKIVYTITPLFFNEESVTRTQQEWTRAFREYYERPYLKMDLADGYEVFAGTRDMMYHTIDLGKLAERYRDFCDPSVLNNPDQVQQLIAEFPRIRDNYYDPEHLRLYPVRKQLLESINGISSQWQMRYIGVDYANIYFSAEMNAVSLFSLRTTAAMEGLANIGSYEFQPLSSTDNHMTVEARAQALKKACEADGPEAAKAFAEYKHDGGKMKDKPKTHEANEAEVDEFFRNRGR
jgi:hypothetical protein